MQRLFFWLSGEHPTLPASEVVGAIEAEGKRFRILEKYDCALVLETDANPLALANRLAFTRRIGLHLWTCEADETQILAAVSNSDLIDLIPRSKSFAVKVHRVRRSAPELNSVGLAGKIAAVLKREVDFKADLENPEVELFALLTEDVCIGGLILADVDTKAFSEREPSRRPVFHPSSLPPKLGRCLVNLARTPRSGYFLDPFCGVGGILIEAGLIGARVVGIDKDPEMVEGAKRNLEWAGIKNFEVRAGDARELGDFSVQAIATDPPYGRQASTRGSDLPQLYSDALPSMAGVLAPHRWMCVSAPQGLPLEDYAREAGLRIEERHNQRVHSTLTRCIYVLKRK